MAFFLHMYLKFTVYKVRIIRNAGGRGEKGRNKIITEKCSLFHFCSRIMILRGRILLQSFSGKSDIAEKLLFVKLIGLIPSRENLRDCSRTSNTIKFNSVIIHSSP